MVLQPYVLPSAPKDNFMRRKYRAARRISVRPRVSSCAENVLEKFPRVAPAVDLAPELARVAFDTPHKVDELAVGVVLDLKFRVLILVKQHPARAAEHLNVAVERSVLRKTLADRFSQQLFAAHSCYRTIQKITPYKISAGHCAPPLLNYFISLSTFACTAL